VPEDPIRRKVSENKFMMGIFVPKREDAPNKGKNYITRIICKLSIFYLIG
jgi:hypothetical protein